MKWYGVPRIIYINKLDRMGANPWAAIDQIRSRLGLHVAAVQVNIGIENGLRGIIDIVWMKAMYFDGDKGEVIRIEEVPKDMLKFVEEKWQELIHNLAEVDESIEEKFLMEEKITEQDIIDSIRKATIALKFAPVFMGSAYKNKGVQAVLDGVIDYLPNPTEKENYAYDLSNKNEKVILSMDDKKPFVGLAFKLQETKYGQVTYVWVYQGRLKKGG